jgi:hypothetical protein
MQDEKPSSNTTVSSELPTTVFGPWNTGICSWRKQRREATTSRVEAFLTSHGSTRLCTGAILYTTRIRFTCTKCGREMGCKWKDLLPKTRIWCKSCAISERMQGVLPSGYMQAKALEVNTLRAAERRSVALLTPSKEIPLEKRSAKAQAKILSQRWSVGDWKVALATAIRIQQRCTNPKASNFLYYGGRGVECRFPSTPILADWLLTNLGPRPPGHSIDRIEVDGHYEPGNLRWATKATQAQNRSSSRRGIS